MFQYIIDNQCHSYCNYFSKQFRLNFVNFNESQAKAKAKAKNLICESFERNLWHFYFEVKFKISSSFKTYTLNKMASELLSPRLLWSRCIFVIKFSEH